MTRYDMDAVLISNVRKIRTIISRTTNRSNIHVFSNICTMDQVTKTHTNHVSRVIDTHHSMCMNIQGLSGICHFV